MVHQKLVHSYLQLIGGPDAEHGSACAGHCPWSYGHSHSSLVQLSRLEYGSSLSSLRSVLAHPRPGSMSAMQNSILVLGMFELYDKCQAEHATQLTLQSIVGKGGSGSQSEVSTWTHHAMGIEQVMRRQGPTGYDRLDMNGFIYLAMRDTLVRTVNPG